MRAAVAIDASGGVTIAALDRLRMEAALVGGLFLGMAGRAGDLLWRRFVRGTLDVGVAIQAREHAAVNRILEPLRIDVQADLLAIDLARERRVTVAGEALVNAGFWRILGRRLGVAG